MYTRAMAKTAADWIREARAFGARGDMHSTARVADEALRLHPDEPELHLMRATVAERLGDWERVLAHAARFEALLPAARPLDVMVGWALVQLERSDEAIARLARATANEPTNPTAWINLGHAHKQRDDLDAYERCQRKAFELAPERPASTLNLAVLEHSVGRVDAAIALLKDFDRRVAGNLDAAKFGALLSLYTPAASAATVVALHRACGDLVAMEAQRLPPPRFTMARSPERTLRVGFFSPDLNDHSVTSFLLPLIESLDRGRVQPVLYSTGPSRDAFTDRFGASAPIHDVCRADDPEVLARVRGDRIDVAVDVAGLTQGNRYTAFAARLAPVQVTWLGYPATTGLATMDARFVDSRTDPPGSEAYCVEKLIRLDPVFVCWRSRVEVALPPRVPLAGAAGAPKPVVFGSFNTLAKLSDPTLDAWSRVLAGVPGSTLLVKSWGLKFERGRRLLLERLAARGVEAGRVELLGFARGQQEHLALYGRVDIALDSFPYNGTTTTLEALWMGTPVVALEGRGHQARVAVSLLGAIGRSDLVAPDIDSYVARAVALAADRVALAREHATLRDALAASPLRDEAGFARRFEAAIRQLWQGWCGRR